MVKGRAKIVITGLMKVLTSPSTTAITRVFTKLEIWTPGRIAAVI
jgi:hypothetical protein